MVVISPSSHPKSFAPIVSVAWATDSVESRVVHFVQGHLCPEASSCLSMKLTFPLTPPLAVPFNLSWLFLTEQMPSVA